MLRSLVGSEMCIRDRFGNGRKDRKPGGSGGPSGPPELDEIVGDIRDKFSRIFSGFGGNGKSARPGSDGSGSDGSGVRPVKPKKSGGRRVFLLIVAIVAVGIWFSSGLYVVQQGERGVELRFGEHTATTQAGLRPPCKTEEIGRQASLPAHRSNRCGWNLVFERACLLYTSPSPRDS